MNVLKCPGCNKSEGIRQVEVNGQRAVCRTCSKSKRGVFQFCCACQGEWPRNASTTNSCALPNCALRAALLSAEQIDDPRSSAKGCPFFRACPGCKALLTHNGVGCPKIVCPKCKMRFCFRCLRQRCCHIDDFTFLRLTRAVDPSLFEELSKNQCTVVSNIQTLANLGL